MRASVLAIQTAHLVPQVAFLGKLAHQDNDRQWFLDHLHRTCSPGIVFVRTSPEDATQTDQAIFPSISGKP